MSDDAEFSAPEGDLSVRVGREQIDVEQRWVVASILNDIMTGLWFVTGSIMNLVGGFGDLSLYFYLAGSSQLLLRAFMRLGSRIHIRGGHRRTRPRIRRASRHDAS